MKRKLFIIVIFATCLILFTYATASAADAPPDMEDAADKLHTLGLYNGVGGNADGTPDFALDRTTTRAEALTMFIKLIGKEAEALGGPWPMPFTDVPDWASPYIGYAYANNLTNGIGGSTFGSDCGVTATEFITLILRALDYSDGTDFEWDRAWVLSDSLGVTDGRYNASTVDFLRGDIALISLAALKTKQKDTNAALYSTLLDRGAITETAAKAAGFGVAVVTPAPTQPAMNNQPDDTSDESSFEKEVFDLVNTERAKYGLSPLEWSEGVAEAAHGHSIDMSQRGYFSHHNPEGLSPADRMRATCSVSFTFSGETLAKGFKTPESVVIAWMSSSGHRSTILSKKATHMGVGFYNYYCTADFFG